MEGMKPGLVPTSLCFPGFPPDNTGDPAGSTTWTVILLSYSFKYSPVPVTVPPVPAVQTNAVNLRFNRFHRSYNFRSCCMPVNIRIGLIFKLHRNKAIWNSCRNFLCLFNCARHFQVAWC